MLHPDQQPLSRCMRLTSLRSTSSWATTPSWSAPSRASSPTLCPWWAGLWAMTRLSCSLRIIARVTGSRKDWDNEQPWNKIWVKGAEVEEANVQLFERNDSLNYFGPFLEHRHLGPKNNQIDFLPWINYHKRTSLKSLSSSWVKSRFLMGVTLLK